MNGAPATLCMVRCINSQTTRQTHSCAAWEGLRAQISVSRAAKLLSEAWNAYTLAIGTSRPSNASQEEMQEARQTPPIEHRANAGASAHEPGSAQLENYSRASWCVFQTSTLHFGSISKVSHTQLGTFVSKEHGRGGCSLSLAAR